MNKEVEKFFLNEGVTQKEINERRNFSFSKVEEMLQVALKKGQELPNDSVAYRFLEVGDIVYYRNYTGLLAHNYSLKPTKVIRVSKTLAYLDNGTIAYRNPKKHTHDNGFHWAVKNGDAVFPNDR